MHGSQRRRLSLLSIRSHSAVFRAILGCTVVLQLAGCGGSTDVAETPPASPANTLPETTTTPGVGTPAAADTGSTAVGPSTPAPEPTLSVPATVEPVTPSAPAVTVDETPRPPATVEQAAALLDLRTFPLLDEAHVPGIRHSIGELHYSAPASVAEAFEFQRNELKKLGWEELPGTRGEGENLSATFTQQGFVVYVSVSPYGQGPNGESRWSSISLGNYGNVSTAGLPVPTGVEPSFSTYGHAAYVTTTPLEETAEACRRLLLDAGWKPYGENKNESPISNSHMLDFKQNAVLLSANISDHSNQPGKTFITYSTRQLTADIPAPPGNPDFRYTDSDKRMHFDTQDSMQDVAAHYVAALAELGWQPTTEQLIVNDEREGMMIFRNEAGERMDLDMKRFTDLTRVDLKHFTTAELVELQRQVDEYIERQQQEAAEREAAAAELRAAQTYAFPLPRQTKGYELEDDSDGMELTLPAGTGLTALAALRQHFRDAGWEEENYVADATAGSLTLKRGESTLVLNFVDIGFGEDCELDVTGFSAYLQPVPAE